MVSRGLFTNEIDGQAKSNYHGGIFGYSGALKGGPRGQQMGNVALKEDDGWDKSERLNN